MFYTVSKFLKTPSSQVLCHTRYVHIDVKISVPWGHLAGKFWNNSGTHPILAVHGWQDNANTFDSIVPFMSPKFSVLAIDLPGHGYSSHFPQGFPYHRMTAILALKRVVNHYNWKNFSLMGHSLGGQTCLLYSAIYPEEVKALATLDILTPTPIDDKRFFRQGGKTIDDFIKRDQLKMESAPTYSFEKLVDMIVKSPISPVSEEAAKILLERGILKTDDGNYRMLRDPKLKGVPTAGWSSEQLLEFCQNVKTNVLCVKAKSSSYFSTKEFFDETWATIQNSALSAELKFVPGGHDVHLQSPELVGMIVNDFFVKYYS